MGNNSSSDINKNRVTPKNNDKINEKTISEIIDKKLDNNLNHKKFILGIIDPQNDFFQGGSLEVSNANEILAPINKLRFICNNNKIKTFISQDYHDPNHMSFHTTHNAEKFKKNNLQIKINNGEILNVEQMMWPKHCVKNTSGSNFHKDLIISKKDKIIQKGININIESYSAFGDEYNNKYENTGLDEWLKIIDVTDIILVGLATDYCVYNTFLDANKHGYKVHLILSCVRGVAKDSTDSAIYDMIQKGVILYVDVDEFCNKNKIFLS